MKDFALGLLGIFVLCAVAFAAWLGLSIAFRALLDLDKALASSIIAAFVAIFSILVTYLRERSKARKEAHRGKKVEVYTIFFDIVFDIIKKSKKDEIDEHLNTDDWQNQFFDLTKGLMLYGSPKVIKAVSDWRMKAADGPSPLDVLRDIDDVFLAIRKDMDLSNSGLDNLLVHQLYVTDDIMRISDESELK